MKRRRPHRVDVLLNAIAERLDTLAVDRISTDRILDRIEMLRESLVNGDAGSAALAAYRLAQLEQKALRRKGAMATKIKKRPTDYAAKVDLMIEQERNRGFNRSRSWCHIKISKANGTNPKSIANADRRQCKARLKTSL